MDLSGHEGEIPIPLTRERMALSAHEGEIPIPLTSTYVGGNHGHAQNHGHNIIHDNPPPIHLPSNGPTPPLSLAIVEDHDHHNHSNSYSSKKGAVLKYRECLKNHAASIGGNATDGCGEFMPSGEEGTLEALKCSACNCHRNFHRKEIEGEASSCEWFHHFKGRKPGSHKGLLISGSDAFGYNGSGGGLIPRPSPHSMIMPLGALQTSESDEMEGVGGLMPRPLMVKKRFRTKFTPEQKEKMLGFAEGAGWKLQKQEESVVQQFCQEIGVKRRVLKVWMHNNKHNLAKKDPLQLE